MVAAEFAKKGQPYLLLTTVAAERVGASAWPNVPPVTVVR